MSLLAAALGYAGLGWRVLPVHGIAESGGCTWLYRHYARDGALLYVGISSDPVKRFEQHKRSSGWAHLVVETSVKPFASRDDAVAAETTAIREEQPAHNLVHNRPSAREIDATLRHERRMKLGWLTITQLAAKLDLDENEVRKILKKIGAEPASRTRPLVYAFDLIETKLKNEWRYA